MRGRAGIVTSLLAVASFVVLAACSSGGGDAELRAPDSDAGDGALSVEAVREQPREAEGDADALGDADDAPRDVGPREPASTATGGAPTADAVTSVPSEPPPPCDIPFTIPLRASVLVADRPLRVSLQHQCDTAEIGLGRPPQSLIFEKIGSGLRVESALPRP